MGKYSDFPSQTPEVRPKSAIYIPKGDEHPRQFYMAPPLPGVGVAWDRPTQYTRQTKSDHNNKRFFIHYHG